MDLVLDALRYLVDTLFAWIDSTPRREVYAVVTIRSCVPKRRTARALPALPRTLTRQPSLSLTGIVVRKEMRSPRVPANS